MCAQRFWTASDLQKTTENKITTNSSIVYYVIIDIIIIHLLLLLFWKKKEEITSYHMITYTPISYYLPLPLSTLTLLPFFVLSSFILLYEAYYYYYYTTTTQTQHNNNTYYLPMCFLIAYQTRYFCVHVFFAKKALRKSILMHYMTKYHHTALKIRDTFLGSLKYSW